MNPKYPDLNRPFFSDAAKFARQQLVLFATLLLSWL
jgi:hypothetical protein